jgi:hypothetical protein
MGDRDPGVRAQRRAPGLAGLLAAAAFFASVPSWAAASLRVPAECGSEAEFERETRARLDREVPALPTVVAIERTGDGYLLRMRVGDELRELRDHDCRELFRAAVVVAVATAMSQSRPAAEPERGAAPRAPVKKEPEREAPAGRGDRAASRLTASLAIGGGAHSGHSPKLVPLVELEAKVSASDFGGALGVRYLAPGSTLDDAGRGVEVEGVGVQLAGLYAPFPLFEARLGVGAFRLSGTGLGSPGDRSDTAWSGGPIAGVSLVPLRRGRVWVAAALEGEWHLVRPAFQILNYGEVFRVSRFGGSALARLGVRFY